MPPKNYKYSHVLDRYFKDVSRDYKKIVQVDYQSQNLLDKTIQSNYTISYLTIGIILENIFK